MAVHIDNASVVAGWTIRRTTAVRPTASGRRAATVDLPGPLRDPSKFIPTEAFQAEVRGVTRGPMPTLAAPLRVDVDVDDNAPRIAVARHESGAVTFHLPERPSVTRGTRGTRRRAGGVRVTFNILVRTPTGPLPTGRRGLLRKVINVVVMKVIDVTAKPLFQSAARKIEQTLWSRAGRAEGWVRVTEGGVAAGRLEHDDPDPRPEQPALLLLHGTFSHTLAAFDSLFRSSTMSELRARYGDQIYGFDHFTMSKSPKENVEQMLDALSGHGATFDCISHSRGGLVLRTLAAARSSQCIIRRAVPVAAPNLGTPLATPQRWEDTLGWFANLMEMFPDNPFTTASGWIAGALSWLAQHVTSDLPGLNSMDANGQIIADLAGTPDASAVTNWYAIASNYTPTDRQVVMRLADMGIEGFFQGANDLVVPTEGCWQFGAAGVSGPPSQTVCFGAGGNLVASSGRGVHHLNFFAQQETRDLILKALAGVNLGVPPISGIQRRGVQRTVDAAANEIVSAGAPLSSMLASPEPAAVSLVPAGLGWDEEDALNLIVLPLPVSEDPGGHQSAQLLATYGSARVLAPFRLGGRTDGVGTKWQRIIQFQKDLNNYAEGSADDLTVDRIRDGGTVLFDVLFQNDVRRLYDQARFQHRRRKLNVVFTSMIPWVADLPWELAYDPSCKSYLALSDVRFVRNVLTPVPADRIDATLGPLRILVVSSVPKNQQPLSEDDERAAIMRSFSRLVDCGLAIVEPLARATPAKLHAKVRAEGVTYDIVHFIGHGEFDEQTQTGFLVFEDDRGGTSRLDTDALRSILRGRGIRLLFLNACVSARGSRADYNKGVAPGMVADGVPAVVANQYSVLDCSATMFAKHFYWCLVQGLSLGDAMRESRIAVNYLVDTGVDWAVPVLFARNPNAMLTKPGGGDGADLFDLDEPHMAVEPTTEEPVLTSRASSPVGLAPEPVKRRRIAVWDVADSLPDLENYLAEMTTAQDCFEFEPVNLTAPLGTWELRTIENTDGRRVAYLTAERIARKMKNIVGSLGVDLLLCVTNLPMRDRDTFNIYLWTGSSAGSSPDTATNVKQNPIAIFSTWGFNPPITGERLAWALANVAVQAMASTVADGPDRPPKRSISYFNAERDIEGVVGRLTIDARTREHLAKTMSDAEIESMERLLALYHSERTIRRPREKRSKPGNKHRAK